MSRSYFFPCLIDGVPKDKTISVEIQARENSYFKSAQIEFINYTPPEEISLRFAGTHLFRGKLKNAQQKPCGRVSAYYETILNCADIQPTIIITREAFNTLVNPTFGQRLDDFLGFWARDVAKSTGGREAPQGHAAEVIATHPWRDPPSVLYRYYFDFMSQTYRAFAIYLDCYDIVAKAEYFQSSSFTLPFPNTPWNLNLIVRNTALPYPPNSLLAFRIARVWYRAPNIFPYDNSPVTIGWVFVFEKIVDDASGYRVFWAAPFGGQWPPSYPVRVFDALGAIVQTPSTAKFIKPIIVNNFTDVIQVLRKFPQNIIIKINEDGIPVGTDVEYIQNTFELTDSVVFDYTLPKPKPIAITMKAEGEGWRYKVEAKDENSCPLATIEINNSDVILESQADINRLLKHFKLNLQERGYLKCVLLPELDLYHKIRFKGKEFRVVGYTHRITKDYAVSEINLVEEVS
ncbi:MAG: hypothetical protein ACO2PP_21870 [Thermocrinis sp.]|jgi:hypothetical protein|uniref:hypothetical protein n=1 Tax=Thermocrinis sp. TaxID=2024383 RepID=UPI003BFF6455